jgi:DNA-binding IclR family transcriptional regulator
VSEQFERQRPASRGGDPERALARSRPKARPARAPAIRGFEIDTALEPRSSSAVAAPLPAAGPAYAKRTTRAPGQARSPRAPSPKARHARRVIDVLGFFSDVGRPATVQEISTHFGWPQSSTSELLSALMELGLVYKPTGRRFYRPTPGAAWLGLGAQPSPIRSGRLLNVMESLTCEMGITAAIIGKVGLDAQIFSWRRGRRADAVELRTGMRIPLHDSAAGWLLLSTLGDQLWPRALHRLRAEAPENGKLGFEGLERRLADCAISGSALGPAGFLPEARLCAVLAPEVDAGQPLVMALMFDRSGPVPADLLTRLREAAGA